MTRPRELPLVLAGAAIVALHPIDVGDWGLFEPSLVRR